MSGKAQVQCTALILPYRMNMRCERDNDGYPR